ncbi:hypothetical protein [Spirillospora sp. NPDC047279]|uniref:hypothetical protein n=1 Tax=Spirillospora sp. NPDC047279 TaxID=3155478 RepID=UPI0033E7EFC7
MLEEAFIVGHIGFGLSAVIAGAVAMLAPKRRGRHPRAGVVYLGALSGVAATAIVIVDFRPHTAFLLLPGGLAAAAAGLGYLARRVRWRGWLGHHIVAMAVSYIALLTAFYVDNGPRLPLWKLLPAISFWFLPAAIGTPILLRALFHHVPPRRLSRDHLDRSRRTGEL